MTDMFLRAAASEIFAEFDAEVLLLTCMDFRLMHDVALYMQNRGLKGKYDHVVLASASLGVLAEKFPNWGQTFWQHLDISIKLHKIEKLIVMDHRDCGAYRMFLDEDFPKIRLWRRRSMPST